MKFPLKKKSDSPLKTTGKSEAPNWFLRLLARVLPTKADDPETLLFKKVAYAIVGMAFLMVFFALTLFFVTLKPDEETMVPKVVGEDVVTAVLELQDKELIPRVQVKFSNDPREKGTVVAQDPQGGLLVRSGRSVVLWVSKGAVVDKVENYIGQNLSDVKLHLKSLFATQPQALIRIKDDPVYVFSNSPEGTVLEQKPQPGTQVSSQVDLELVVSRGPKGQMVKVGTYAGQYYTDALALLSSSSIPFVFKARKVEGSETPGRVVSQNPAPGAEIPKGTVVNLVMASPTRLPEGQVFGVFETTLPEYPILVDLKLELRKTGGDSTVLIAMKHPGGAFAVPYQAAVGDTLVLSILDKEIFKQKVTP